MKQCPDCKAYFDESVEKCPLCGKTVTHYEDNGFLFAGFELEAPRHTKTFARRVTYVLSFLFLLVIGIIAGAKKDAGVFCIGATALAFSWLTVFRFVFYRTNVRKFIVKFSYSVMLLLLLVMLHFDKVMGGGFLWLAVSLMLPIVNGGAILCLSVIALIKKNLTDYAFSVFWTSVASIGFLIANVVLNLRCGGLGYIWLPSMIAGIFGAAALAFLLSAGRRVLLVEFRKKFYMNTSKPAR